MTTNKEGGRKYLKFLCEDNVLYFIWKDGNNVSVWKFQLILHRWSNVHTHPKKKKQEFYDSKIRKVSHISFHLILNVCMDLDFSPILTNHNHRLCCNFSFINEVKGTLTNSFIMHTHTHTDQTLYRHLHSTCNQN